MKRVVLSGILLSLLTLSARQSLADARVTIEACNGVDASAVDRILDMEYRNAAPGPLLVRLSCAADNVTVRVRHADSAERVLVVDLSAVLAVAKPRTIALLIVELSNEIVASLAPEPMPADSANAGPVPAPVALAPVAAPLPPPVPAAELPSAAPAPVKAQPPIEEPPLAATVYAPAFSAAPGSGEDLGTTASEEELGARPFGFGSPRLSGALGYSMVSQNFSTPDTCLMCNYRIEIGAPSANVGAQIDASYGSRYVFAADFDYQYAASQIHVTSQDGFEMSETGYQQHRLHAGARAGYELDKPSAIAAYARTGVQYERLVIENPSLDDNTAKLPSEMHTGLTLGAMFEFAKLTPKTSLGVSADILILGRVNQTQGLTDGVLSSTSAHYLGAHLDYQWSSTLSLTWNYSYSQQKTNWSGVDPNSLRDHNGPWAARTDSLHAIFAGLSTTI